MKYIHQRADWPAFRWDEAAITRRLGAVRLAQGRLLGRMGHLTAAARDGATLAALTAEILQTSEIEGEHLNADQVRSSLARKLGIKIGALTPADRNVEGIVEIMLDATRNYAAPLSDERLFGWHGALFPTGRSGLAKISVAAWRTAVEDPMQVVSGALGRERVHFEAPPAQKLPKEMRAFMRWFNGPASETLDPLLKAAIAHLWFVTIHPFADGNGRIARAIADLVLARSEASAERYYSMSTAIRAERKAYYQILEATQKGDLDISEWLIWFLDRLDAAIAGADEVLASVLAKARLWDRLAHEPINDRQRAMLNRLLDGFVGKLTTQKWAKLAKCSHDTALRDINDLVERAILTKEAAGGRSSAYTLAK